MNNNGQGVELLLFLVLGGLLIACLFALLVWVMRDAESRGKSGCLVVLLVLCLPVPGLLIWLIFRPDKIDPNHPSAAP